MALLNINLDVPNIELDIPNIEVDILKINMDIPNINIDIAKNNVFFSESGAKYLNFRKLLRFRLCLINFRLRCRDILFQHRRPRAELRFQQMPQRRIMFLGIFEQRL